MTCIEFFDRESIEDVCTCFAAKADRVIFIGEDKKLMESYIRRYERVFTDRGIEIRFETVSVRKDDLSDAVGKIEALIEARENEDEAFVFDLTGGDDLCLVAMGIVFERYRSRGVQIQMHRFNLRNNKITDCDADGTLLTEREAPRLSIEENVRVFGGDVVYDGDAEHGSVEWNMTPAFIGDIEAMWEILRSVGKYGTVGSWNKQIKTFEAIEECGEIDGLTSRAGKSVLEACLARDGEKLKSIAGVIRRLRECRLAEVEEDDRSITVTYKNGQVKRCLTKAGQALEMIVYLYALQAVDKQRMRVYNDVMTGVYIDWDGDIHTDQEGFDTENEIDVMMMHGAIPVFISCKNGKIDMDELYKLDAVATKFGGKYARRVLVATSLGKSRFASYFRQRAKDMGVDLLEPMDLTDAEFRAEIGHAWSYITKREPQA